MQNKDLMLIDGDILLYRSAFACKDMSDWADVKDYIHTLFQEMIQEVDSSLYIGFLQGRDNFRKEVSKQAVYKGNRKSGNKPFWFNNIRVHLEESYQFQVINGMETDDALTILHRREMFALTIGSEKLTPVICSIDKDLLQSPGNHYNINTKEVSVSTDFFGESSLAKQVLMGDTTDNIPGLQGVGEKGAEKILAEVTDTDMFLPTALQHYMNYYFEKRKKGKAPELVGLANCEIMLLANKHFSETLELVMLRRTMEDFITPIVLDFDELENPLDYGAKRPEEQSGSTVLD